jgi:hypothetical protein
MVNMQSKHIVNDVLTNVACVALFIIQFAVLCLGQAVFPFDAFALPTLFLLTLQQSVTLNAVIRCREPDQMTRWARLAAGVSCAFVIDPDTRFPEPIK